VLTLSKDESADKLLVRIAKARKEVEVLANAATAKKSSKTIKI